LYKKVLFLLKEFHIVVIMKTNLFKSLLVSVLLVGAGTLAFCEEADKSDISDKEKPRVKKQDKEFKQDREIEKPKKGGLKKQEKWDIEKPEKAKEKKKEGKDEELNSEKPSKEKKEVIIKKEIIKSEEQLPPIERKGDIRERQKYNKPAPLPPDAREKVRIAIENLRSAGYPGIADLVERITSRPHLRFQSPLLRKERQFNMVRPEQRFTYSREEVRNLHNEVAELREQVKRNNQLLEELQEQNRRLAERLSRNRR